MTEQASSTSPTPTPEPAPVASAPTTSAPTPGEDVAPIKARMAVLESELARAREEAAKYRKRNDEETQAKLKEQGDFKTLYEQALPSLEKAKRYDAILEKQKARVEAEVSTLPAFLQLAVRKAPSVEDAVEILDTYKSDSAAAAALAASAAPKAQPTKASPTAAPAATPPTPIDIDRMSPAEIRNLMATEPERLNALIGRKPPPSSNWLAGVIGRK